MRMLTQDRTDTYLVEDVEFLTAHGCTLAQAAARLIPPRTPEALQRNLQRLGRHDLSRAFTQLAPVRSYR